jgi:putative ABC transport system ATP-binding protein
VLLADEPTGNLDSASGAMVLRLLRRLVDDGQTVVMVTHDPGAASLADRVVFLRDGEIVDEVAGGDGGRVIAALATLEAAPS